ncbi:TIGR03862 family flavoprotein [Jeongeupia chitinilytica]|uniref:NAD(FAD)-utilizing dehydrogenase n=1 Tax=Jeongeupia chitinilytica TaxID=1041641 RepID=A0ABQ3H152_9NEIS|nr:TIGR03862 family flavoprotein [Jeongeupia chitinilytica]GHD62234.1 NAD(FAD)-utilizing dehydrogenase [Jeongeupia chitinilytica]
MIEAREGAMASAANVAVIGGGPAGLMAAEQLAAAGHSVAVYDAMPSFGRKFLLAGIGGMNITHSEPLPVLLDRYGERRDTLAPLIHAFGPDALRAWIAGLGIDTFVGSSGKVFPTEMKAAPLLRAWLARLRAAGVVFHTRHRWTGWNDAGALAFDTPHGAVTVDADATVLALGGGSWARLGSDGAWVPWLQGVGADIAPLAPANCGFDAGWSTVLAEKFAGAPIKSVALTFTDAGGKTETRRGEFVLTQTGIEGNLVYAFAARIRDAIAAQGEATVHLDLLPDFTLAKVEAEVAHPRGSRSMASHLQSRLNLKGAKASLLRECTGKDDFADPARLAARIKALPVRLLAARPLDEAISSAGGVRFEALDNGLMLRAKPGVFCAGEMLDWEAPTGGYLLTACFATGCTAGLGAADWLAAQGEKA